MIFVRLRGFYQCTGDLSRAHMCEQGRLLGLGPETGADWEGEMRTSHNTAHALDGGNARGPGTGDARAAHGDKAQ